MSEDYKNSLELAEKTSKDISEQFLSFVITTDDDYAHATDFLKLIKNKIKAIDDTRKDLVKPFNDGVKKINILFKTPIDNITSIKTSLEDKMLVYAREKAAKELEEQKKLKEEEARKLREEAALEKEVATLFNDNKLYADAQANLCKASAIEAQEIKVAPVRSAGQFSTSTIRKKWTYEIIEANKIPTEFLCPDDDKIKQAIAAGVRNIDGIKIYEKEILVSR